jgi:Ca2+-dependent lipid-binding protein
MSENKAKHVGAWGNIHVTLHEAKGLRDTESLGKQDPFAKLKLSKRELRTKVHDGGGKIAKWEDTLEFSLKSREDEANFALTVTNHNVLSDTEIGSASFPVNDWVKSHPNKKWYPIAFQGKPAGEVLISVVWKPALVLQIVEGKNLFDAQSIGKQDPYVLIKIGKDKEKNKSKTTVCDNGGKNPKFNKQFLTFVRPLPPKKKPDVKDAKANEEPTFEIEVWDHNTVKDAFIGSTKLTWSAAEKTKNRLTFHALTREEGKKPAGEIGITVTDWKWA